MEEDTGRERERQAAKQTEGWRDRKIEAATARETQRDRWIHFKDAFIQSNLQAARSAVLKNQEEALSSPGFKLTTQPSGHGAFNM